MVAEESCPWCLEGGICRAGDRATCDFKNLPMQMNEITKRIDEEFSNTEALMGQMREEQDEKALFELMRKISDKLSGMVTMRQVLMEKFNKNYFPKGRFEFMKLIYEVHKKMRKYGGAQDGGDRPKRGDEMAGQKN
jgi:hypothetical protein